jgi:hypothetical protein
VSWLALSPLLVFLALGGVFGYQLLFGNPANEVPSVLIGQEAPAVTLAPLEDSGVPGFGPASSSKGRLRCSMSLRPGARPVGRSIRC